MQIGLDTGYWTAINHFFIWGSVAVYFAILFAMHSNGLFDMFPNQFRFVGESLASPGVTRVSRLFWNYLVGGQPALREQLLSAPQVPVFCKVLGEGWVCVSDPSPALSGFCVHESEEQPYSAVRGPAERRTRAGRHHGQQK